jgi:hypothetical protein
MNIKFDWVLFGIFELTKTRRVVNSKKAYSIFLPPFYISLMIFMLLLPLNRRCCIRSLLPLIFLLLYDMTHVRPTDSLLNPIKYSKCLQSYSASYRTCALSPSQISLPRFDREKMEVDIIDFTNRRAQKCRSQPDTECRKRCLNHTKSDIHNVWPITNLCLFCILVTPLTRSMCGEQLCVPSCGNGNCVLCRVLHHISLTSIQ